MPTYEYHCPKCGDFEAYQSIKDEALKVCPTCRSKKITKRVSAGAGVIFSGPGFWETDYNRSKDYTSKKKSESTPAPAAAPSTPAATPAAAPAASDPKPAAAPAKPASGAAKPTKTPPAK